MNEFNYQHNMQPLQMDGKLPMTVQEVVRLVNEPRTSVARLAAAVAKHQALAESVLRKANASAYGFPGRVKNLNSAVVVLGFDALKETLRNLLMATTGRNVVHTVIRHQELWEHSIGCAMAARMLAEKSGKCRPDDAYIAGLFHDVGALFAPRTDAREKNAPVLTGLLSAFEAKRMFDGMTRFIHAHVGADKAREWGVAEDIVEAIRFHHLPRLATCNPSLAGIVHVAEFLCHRLRVGAAPFEHADHCDTQALATLNLTGYQSIDQMLGAFDTLLLNGVQQTPPFGEVVKDVTGRLIDAIGGLREKQRMIVALYYYEGLSLIEIGQLLEIPVSTASADLSGAVGQLQNVLQIHI